MQNLDVIVDWLSNNESALSAVAAIFVISGIVYGALRYVLAPIFQRAQREPAKTKLTDHKKPKQEDAIKPLHDTHLSLAVLLFESLSSDEEDQFLASGITAEVISHVASVPEIRVSSRMSSYQFKTGQADMSRVAEELNTSRVLTGSLQHSGNRIRVIARLTDIESDTEMWAHTYDRQIEDLFDVQQDIAKCIVAAVLGEVKLAKTLRAGSAATNQLDAWGLVQKAYHFWLTAFSPQGILDACDYLRQAIKIDHNYASARASLAMLLAQQMTSRICEDYDACAIEARELIERAYQQEPNDLDVLENAGVVWQNLGESKRAEQALRRVVELAPLNLISRGYLALLLAFTGDEEGAVEAQKIIYDNFVAAPKHPATPYWNYFLAISEQRLGHHDSAIELAKSSLLSQPGWVHSHYVVANSHCINGNYDAAKEAIDSALAINPYLTPALHAENVYLITGCEEKSQTFVGGLKKCGFIE